MSNIWSNKQPGQCNNQIYSFHPREEVQEKEEIGAANYAMLEKIKINQREEHLKVFFLFITTDFEYRRINYYKVNVLGF